MKFTGTAFVFAVLSSSATLAMAEDNTTLSKMGLSFSGSAALTTDYRFRGMTQTQSDPAVQGSFTLAHKSGVYFSAFASNVNFGTPDPHLELDPSIGFTTPLNLSANVKPILDIGVIEYNYPSAADDFNWTEAYAKLTFADVGIKGSSLLTNVNYTNDWAAVGGNSWNFTFAYSAPIADTGFGGVASVGYTTMDKEALPDAKDHYVDWKVGVNYGVKSIPGLTAELAAIGTNVDTDGLSDATQRGLETGAVFTLSKTF
ncbi:TorF family putative porin [Acinetobacter sp. ANC 4648]|uniref:TorF family putative porin n=1 Tax=Acinetobacter sp. ANC 4648 TaxID=1977875 RepID=UPI000A3351C5|nr:TorF family putative porin [Acinetobacter sp. ANC 4648]OTG81161.1 hypothetical protein B9T27_11980 [Acinetobacter sp. ANC 4648]